MTERIIIQPEADTGMACWALTSSSGTVIRRGSLENSAAAINGHQVVLAVSGRDVLLTHTDLPARARHPARIIPYALEEYLADEVDHLHFSHNKSASDNTTNVNVAVSSRAHMAEWLAQAEQAGIEPDVVIPDTLLLPLTANCWSVHVSSDTSIVRTGEYTGFSCETENLPLMLSNAVHDSGDQLPASIYLYKHTDSTIVPPLDHTGIDIIVADKTGNIIELMDVKSDAALALNLRQGAFRKPFRMRGDLRLWRQTAIVAGIWLLLVLVTSIIEYTYLSGKESELKQEIINVYRSAFPDSKRITDPHAQMESKLKQMRKGAASGGNGFLSIMGQAGAVIKSQPAVSISSLSYRNGKLELEVKLKNLPALDDFKQQLSAKSGLSVDVQSASSRDGQVTAQLSLRKP